MVDINAQSNLEDNVGLPWATFLYTVSTLQPCTACRSPWVRVATAWGVQTAERMLREAGFSDVVVHDVKSDPFDAYFVAHP